MKRLRGPVRLVDRYLAVPFVLALRLYRAVVSPIYGDTCRFYPSCSAYSLESLQRHGLARGVQLTVWRLLRCNPWNAGGVDLVPVRRVVPLTEIAEPALTGTPSQEQECHDHGEPVVRRAA